MIIQTLFTRLRDFLKRPEHTFLVVAGLFGLLFVFLIPPFQAPDELSHFFRAYQVSDRQVVATTYEYQKHHTIGGALPESVKNVAYDLQLIGGKPQEGAGVISPREIATFIHKPLEAEKEGTAQFAGAALYTPAPYVAQATGIGLARLVKARPLFIFYIARLCNLALFIALAYIAIRLIPVGKWGLTVIALLPTTLTQAASVSADTTTNALAFVIVAYFLYLYFQRTRLSAKALVGLAASIVLLTLAKPAFIVFAALPFLLPVKRYNNQWLYWLFSGSVALVCLVLAAAWSHTISDFIAPMITSLKPWITVDPNAQLMYVLTHPLHFLHNLISTYFGMYGTGLLMSFVGTQYPIPMLAISISYVTLFGIWLAEPKKQIISQRLRFSLSVLLVAGVLAISLALYLSYNVVGAANIGGLNGRYFIPLAPLAMLVVMSGKWRLVIPRHQAIYLAAGILFPLVAVVAKLSNIFYGWHI